MKSLRLFGHDIRRRRKPEKPLEHDASGRRAFGPGGPKRLAWPLSLLIIAILSAALWGIIILGIRLLIG